MAVSTICMVGLCPLKATAIGLLVAIPCGPRQYAPPACGGIALSLPPPTLQTIDSTKSTRDPAGGCRQMLYSHHDDHHGDDINI